MSADDETQPSHTTTRLPVVTPTEVAIAQLTRAVESGFREMGADIKLVSNDLGIVKDRLVIVENWKNTQDERSSRTSARVQQASEQDLAQAAQLAQERAAREELAKKVEALDGKQDTQLAILARLDKVASNPAVKTILTVIATVLGTWAATKGLK